MLRSTNVRNFRTSDPGSSVNENIMTEESKRLAETASSHPDRNPLVSIVVVTWNRKDEVLETLQSIYKQAYKSYETIVVDNASIDDTINAVNNHFPDVRIIALEENRGASGGRNPGIAAAKGEIIFILDSDASIGQETITNVVSKFGNRPDVGAIACKVVNAYTRQLDRTAGWIYSERDKSDQDTEFLSFSFSECGCAFRKETLARSGLFSTSLFFGREGEELSLRIWDSGYKILYYPAALVFHRVSPEQRVKGADREYYGVRNSLRIYLTKYPWWMLIYFLPAKVLLSTIRGAVRGHLNKIFRALWDVTLSLPTLLKDRQPIRHETARLYLQLMREHGPLRWNLVTWFKYKI
jgi:GT2 family glycosyltransferase